MTHFLIRLFIKDYKQTTQPAVRVKYGHLAALTGIISNVLLFFLKLFCGLFFGSIAIVADAINNLSDAISSVITFVGFKLSAKPADSDHPFGHARMEYVAGLLVSFFIIFLSLQLFKSAFSQIIHPKEAHFGALTLLLLLLSMLVKLWQCIFYRHIAKTIDSVTLFAVSIDSRNDILATGAILLGIVITLLTGFNTDGYLGLMVSIIIFISGIRLVIDTVNPLLGMAPDPKILALIRDKILNTEGILGIHDLHIHNYGAANLYAYVHCEMPAEMSLTKSHEIVDKIERDLLAGENIHLLIHVDPVISNDPKAVALKAQIGHILNTISPDLDMHDFRVVWGRPTKVIFDVVLPFDTSLSEPKMLKKIKTEIKKINADYEVIIIVDRQ